MNIERTKTLSVEIKTTSYEDLASEYYDVQRHPTCANFREASAYLIENWLKKIETESLAICEVGAGDSLVAELLKASSKSFKKLYITDKSRSMLDYSAHWASERVLLHVSDATNLPFNSASIDLLISSLGDPYNRSNFWREANRVLTASGTVIFTTPAHEWSLKFRSIENSKIISAEFELRNGQVVAVPSYIHSREEQAKLLEQSGFEVLEHGTVPLSKLTSKKISPKLTVGNGEYILEGYLIKKI